MEELKVFWIVATFLALMLWGRARSGHPAGAMLAGVRLTAVAGDLSTVVVIAGSVQAGAVCLT